MYAQNMSSYVHELNKPVSIFEFLYLILTNLKCILEFIVDRNE